MTLPRAAFYAPLKSPDHPVPSGDRTVARLYRKVLERAGFSVELASALRGYDGAGDAAAQAAIEAGAERERARLGAAWRASPALRPRLWATYHLYYKAPDLLGPPLCAEFGIPYVVVEPSHAPKRAAGGWAAFHRACERAIAAADLAILPTTRDATCVRMLRGDRPSVVIPPFIDIEGWPEPPSRRPETPLRMIAVAMMRAGDKLRSYRLLAESLAALRFDDWRLTVVGEGPARADVAAAFAPFGERVRMAGLLAAPADLAAALSDADLFVWPAVNEAYGMALLEAQAMGLPVVAGDEGGVAEVVRHGQTGLLAPPRDPAAFARAIETLAEDSGLRLRLGREAGDFVRSERTLPAAARAFADALRMIGAAA